MRCLALPGAGAMLAFTVNAVNRRRVLRPRAGTNQGIRSRPVRAPSAQRFLQRGHVILPRSVFECRGNPRAMGRSVVERPETTSTHLMISGAIMSRWPVVLETYSP